MKVRATKKEILEGAKVISVGYCELQSLLAYESPFAYSAGIYGWSCDYYNIDGIVISTGYSPVGKHTDYELVKKYEAKANAIRSKHMTYDNKKRKLYDLAVKFVREVVQ